MPLTSFKRHVAHVLASPLGLEPEDIEKLIEYPPHEAMGDLAVPCFSFAKTLRRSPVEIARQTVEKLSNDERIQSWTAEGPYINVKLNRQKLGQTVIRAILTTEKAYGSLPPTGDRLIIDYSSPNIAKAFHIGHLRSTIIGNSLKLIFRHRGWDVVGINHVGDWGTQFGKLIVAYRRWGERHHLNGPDPIAYLEKLYVRFHEELTKEPSLEDHARRAFKDLEDGDPETREIWEVFRDLSLRKFQELYDLLEVDFDQVSGESSYCEQLEDTIGTLTDAGLTRMSEGALVVSLEDYDMPACLLRKSDGASLYATRDLAAALYRLRTWNPRLLLYVHGAPQRLHFAQFFKVLELLDADNRDRFRFAGFGQYRFNDKKLSTRAGNVIHLEDVINEGIRRVKTVMNAAQDERIPSDPERVSQQVAIGALVFGDLSSDRTKDINFDWDRMLDFEGDTGPYVQYTHARCRSLLRKAGGDIPDPSRIDVELLTSPDEGILLMALARFPEALEAATSSLKPHHLAQHLLSLARSFNRYYHNHPGILKQEPSLRQARIALVASVARTVKTGLGLLGVPAPESM